MGQQAVGEGEHGVDGVQRRATAAPLEGKRLFIPQDHLVKNAEIGGGPHPLQAPQFLRSAYLLDLRQQSVDLLGGGDQFFAVHPQTVVPAGALDAPAGVEQLAEDHSAADLTALSGIIPGPILCPAEQDVSVPLAAHPGQKFSSGGTER